MHHIIDNIFVGSIFSLADPKQLNVNNISTIVNLVPIPEKIKNNSILYYEVLFEDDPTINLIPLCDKILDIIKTNNGNILVSCMAGKSRSVSAIIYYIMQIHGYNFTQAYDLVKSKHPETRLNRGFYEQLEKYY